MIAPNLITGCITVANCTGCGQPLEVSINEVRDLALLHCNCVCIRIHGLLAGEHGPVLIEVKTAVEHLQESVDRR